MAHTIQILEKVTKNGNQITATLFQDEEKVAKSTMPYNFADTNKKTHTNYSFSKVASDVLQKAGLRKRLGDQISKKGTITTYSVI